MPERLVTFRGTVRVLVARGTGRVRLLLSEQGEKRYRVRSAAGAWEISARAVHLHREIAAEFYRAIPPRPVPCIRRALWRIVLTLAASRAGLLLLRALRR